MVGASVQVTMTHPEGKAIAQSLLVKGPIDKITGVLSAFVEPLGRRTSACRVASPALDGDWTHASDQSASG